MNRILFLAREASSKQWVISYTYAATEIQAQAQFNDILTTEQKEAGFFIVNTRVQENSPFVIRLSNMTTLYSFTYIQQ